jgi:hypothetical protein
MESKRNKKTFGTFCAKRKNVPPLVKNGEYCGQHSDVVALAWRNKQVTTTSTYHKDELCVAINKVNCEETKTVVVCDYNVNMLRLDMTDQAILSGMKGRYKVVFEIIDETTQ